MTKDLRIACNIAIYSFTLLCVASVMAMLSFRGIPKKVNAILDTSQKTVLQLRLTIDNVNDAALEEKFYLHNTLPVLTQQVQTNLTNANALLISLKNTSDTVAQSANTITTQTAATLNTANGLLAHTDTNLQPVLQNLSAVSLSAQTLIADPSIKASLTNIQETSANVAVATKESAQILKDGRIVADKYVQPERWFIKVLHYTLQGGSLAYDFIR